VGTASARLGLHRRDIRHQPTLRAAVSAQFQLSRPADSQVIAPHHRLHPNLVPSQGRTPGCASRRRTRPGPTRSQFGPLRTSVMSNSDYRNHPALARKLQACLRWRNAQGSLPRHAGRPAPRARPHPQRTPATLRPPQTQGCLTNPVNVRGQRTSGTGHHAHYRTSSRRTSSDARFCRRWDVSKSRNPGPSGLLARTLWRSFSGRLINASILPAAEADAGALDLPVDTPVRLPSGNDGRGRARAGEHLVTDKWHCRAAGLWNDGTFVGKVLVQRHVPVLGPGPGSPGARACWSDQQRVW
jgi:hypothetical protein